MIVGVLSDTHGSLHAGVVSLFRTASVELILHAGDVGKYSVLEELEKIAPVVAVRGNIDTNGEVARLPLEARLSKEGVDVYMTYMGGKPPSWLPTCQTRSRT
jgi:putative phosphoesterase